MSKIFGGTSIGYNGQLSNKRITVLSTGFGSYNNNIAINELDV
ncbi:MAG: hypothetical protein WEA59_00210 [Ferruginibacter sp.]